MCGVAAAFAGMFEERRKFFAICGVVSTDAKIIVHIKFSEISNKLIIQIFCEMSMIIYK